MQTVLPSASQAPIHPAVTACSACCIADRVWRVERERGEHGGRREAENMREAGEQLNVWDCLRFKRENEHDIENVVGRERERKLALE